MKVLVIGGHGGISQETKGTSYLIDDKFLIDAGSVASGISLSEQLKIENIFISHSHLDHITDLAFLADNCLGFKDEPFKIYTSETARDNIMKHILNDVIWPNFTKIPSKERPILEFHIFQKECVFQMNEYCVTAVPVNHPAGAHGLIVQKGQSTLLFTQDTGPTERIWQLGKQIEHLKAVFTETSFPNELQELADKSYHHTPNSIKEEIKKMPIDVPIFLGHMKPYYQTQIIKEITGIGCERISLLTKDNVSYIF